MPSKIVSSRGEKRQEPVIWDDDKGVTYLSEYALSKEFKLSDRAIRVYRNEGMPYEVDKSSRYIYPMMDCIA